MTQENQKKRSILIAGLMIAMLFAALDGTIVGTAMPRIVGELGGLDQMAWLTTAYLLTSTTIVPIAGKLADLFGRKVIYVIGISIFIIGSALCGAANGMTELIIFRALQGLGGGIMMPMVFVIVGDVFTGKERAKWQGVFGGIYGLASVIGPQVGGWLVDSLNWRWVFYINLPVGLLAGILIFLGLESKKTTGPVRIDFPGIITMSVGIVSLLLGLSLGGKEYAWDSWQILSLFALSAVGFISFVLVERIAEDPILSLRLFKNRIFTSLNLIGFFMAIGMFGGITFIPLFMQGVIGVSASTSGTIMTPMMLSMIVASVIGGRLVWKIGVKVQLILGMAIMAIGYGMMTTFDLSTTKLFVTAVMLVTGLGMGLVMPTINLALQESFPKEERGVVTSSAQFFRQIGGTIGITVLNAVLNNRSSSLLADRLLPKLAQLPPQIQPMTAKLKEMATNDPQALFSVLLNPDAMKRIPSFIAEKVLPVIKNTLVDALHPTFLLGLGLILIGLIVALIGKSIPLTDRREEQLEKDRVPEAI